MKKVIIAIISLIAIFALAITVFLTVYKIQIVLRSDSSSIVEKHLAWDESMNKHQKGNTCAAFSISAYEFSHDGIIEDPYKIYNNISNKMKNGYVFPWDIVNYLAKKKIDTRIYWFVCASDETYSNWIKKEIDNGNPVIVIEDNKGVLHYFTVLGFKDDTFNVFDSTFNVQDNGMIEGNGYMSKDELLQNMRRAKFSGINIRMGISR
jgi:hypothetical protein